MTAAIPLAENLWRIPTAPLDLINSYLLRSDDGQLTLIDTGTKGAPRRIAAAIREIGSAMSEVTTIVLTHAHPDHAGGAAEFAQRLGSGMTVHEDDAEYVREGKAPPASGARGLGRLFLRPNPFAPAPVVRTLSDGEELAIAGGVRVVHTPGHTPGHISLLHLASGTLITGDAIWNVFSRRTWPVLALCTSAALTEETAHVLGELDYRTAAFTHGPHIADSGRDAVRSFLARPRRLLGHG